jgi:hypothetical protein
MTSLHSSRHLQFLCKPAKLVRTSLPSMYLNMEHSMRTANAAVCCDRANHFAADLHRPCYQQMILLDLWPIGILPNAVITL